MKFTYCDTNTGAVTQDINLLFPDFGKGEVLAVMSPHDDDAIIGAGYAMLAAQQAGADVYVVIFCRGDAGYSTVEEKETIYQTTLDALKTALPVLDAACYLRVRKNG